MEVEWELGVWDVRDGESGEVEGVWEVGDGGSGEVEGVWEVRDSGSGDEVEVGKKCYGDDQCDGFDRRECFSPCGCHSLELQCKQSRAKIKLHCRQSSLQLHYNYSYHRIQGFVDF